jgi:hypothetical protein
MIRLHGVVHCEIITSFEGSIAPFRVFIVQVGRVPFNGELLYTIAPFRVFSGVGGVGAGVSLGKNHAGILLILFGLVGSMRDPFGDVWVRGAILLVVKRPRFHSL